MLFNLYNEYIKMPVQSSESIQAEQTVNMKRFEYEPKVEERSIPVEKVIKTELYSRACSIYSRARKRKSSNIL